MTYNDWHVYTRDAGGVRQGEVDDFTSLSMIPTFIDVGTWSMKINADSPQADALVQPGWGIIAQRDGLDIFAGPVGNMQYDVDPSTNQLSLTGFDDNVWIKRRDASPQPTTAAPPYSTNQFDVRTGVASTVIQAYANFNLGPGAIGARQLDSLTMDTDPIVGSTISGSARWDNLLAFIQNLAIQGGVGFRIAQVGNARKFQTYQPHDLSSVVKFSIGLGNVTKYSYTDTAPIGNYFFVNGDGDGTAMFIMETSDSSSIQTWGRIEGDLVSGSGTTATDPNIISAYTDAFTSGAEQTSLDVTLTDTPQSQYKIDYDLGDTVVVQLIRPIRTKYGIVGRVVDTIQSVTIDLEAGAGATVTPQIASVPKSQTRPLFRDFKSIKRRINRLERG